MNTRVGQTEIRGALPVNTDGEVPEGTQLPELHNEDEMEGEDG